MRLALFDLDSTLLPIDSDYEWGNFTVRLGWVDPVAFAAQNEAFFSDYKLGKLDGPAYCRFATEAVVRQGKLVGEAARAQYMQEVIEPHIRPEALALIDKHRQLGDQLVIVTATNEFVTAPIAKRLGIEHLIAVKLKRDATGWITQDIDGTPSMQEGKVTRVTEWLAERGKNWADVTHSSFYSDSMNDLALLEHVDQPIATNPSDALRALALARGWQVLDLFSSEA